MRFIKITLPVAIVFAMAIVGLIYFVPHFIVANFMNENQLWQKIFYGVTIFIATYSVLKVHFGKIKRQQKGWGYSVLLCLSFGLVAGFAAYNNGAGPILARDNALYDGVRWMYDAVIYPAGATTYSMLGFFICSAAYRTLRAKTLEAGILLAAALIVMLGQVPIGENIWSQIPTISGWIMDYPNMAVKRAVMFGICVGGIGMSLRVMFGIERLWLGGD